MSRIIRFDSKYIEGKATYEGTKMVCVPKAKYTTGCPSRRWRKNNYEKISNHVILLRRMRKTA